jgi:hypothetical protein
MADPIEFNIGPDRARLWAHWGTSQLAPATEADLRAAGFVPLAALQAAEAQLSALQAEHGHLVEAAELLRRLRIYMGDGPGSYRAMCDWYDRDKARQSTQPSPSGGAMAEGSAWREAIENALGVESDPAEHTPSWAYERVLTAREIGNGVRNESGPIEPAKEPAKGGDGGERCHKCGNPANVNDGDDGLGPPVCVSCYDAEWKPSPPVAEPSAAGGFVAGARELGQLEQCLSDLLNEAYDGEVYRPERIRGTGLKLLSCKLFDWRVARLKRAAAPESTNPVAEPGRDYLALAERWLNDRGPDEPGSAECHMRATEYIIEHLKALEKRS